MKKRRRKKKKKTDQEKHCVAKVREAEMEKRVRTKAARRKRPAWPNHQEKGEKLLRTFQHWRKSYLCPLRANRVTKIGAVLADIINNSNNNNNNDVAVWPKSVLLLAAQREKRPPRSTMMRRPTRRTKRMKRTRTARGRLRWFLGVGGRKWSRKKKIKTQHNNSNNF